MLLLLGLERQYIYIFFVFLFLWEGEARTALAAPQRVRVMPCWRRAWNGIALGAITGRSYVGEGRDNDRHGRGGGQKVGFGASPCPVNVVPAGKLGRLTERGTLTPLAAVHDDGRQLTAGKQRTLVQA